MKSLLALLFFISLCYIVESFSCPNNGVQIPNEDVCIYENNQTDLYLDAYKYCVSIGGIPVKIRNIFENAFVFASFSGDVAPYIGLERKENNTWVYADGTALMYENWASDEPNVSNNCSTCAIMDPQTRKWMTAECSYERPYFCSVNGNDTQCPTGWVYNKIADSCYYLQNFTYTDGVDWQLYDWIEVESHKTKRFSCPNNGIKFPSSDFCLIESNKTDFYIDVYKYCRSIGGIPVKITNELENKYVFALTTMPEDQTPYIGVERKSDNTWTYADGTPLIWSNWAQNEPNLSNNCSTCAVISLIDGRWKAAECTYKKPYFCSVNGDDFQCPVGWVYSEQTDFCYYLQNFTNPDNERWPTYNVSTAELKCQEIGAHLVSIHSEDEDDFVKALILSNVKNLKGKASCDYPCDCQWAWNGYYGNGQLGSGKWTDGSQDDYFGSTHYTIPTSNYYNWVMGHDPSCNAFGWDYAISSYHFPRFVCKRPTINRIKKEKIRSK